jgi:L-lactate dehydrogenase complex protein LldF
VGELFAKKLGVPYSDDPQVLTKIARRVLREKFLSADAGISGANFAAADSGSLVLFTNEGNGRMVTTVPPLHIAILSIEKIIPSMADHPMCIRLLPRSATRPAIPSYVLGHHGDEKSRGGDGGEGASHRSSGQRAVGDPGRRMPRDLKCIRCGACMNVCPVYRTVGGHSYGWTYPGPMGVVLTTLLTGMKKSHPLVDASTLCGACVEVCPVRVPLVDHFLALRQRRVREGFSAPMEKRGMRLFGAAAKSPALFAMGQRFSRAFWPLLRKIGGEKVAGRLPAPAAKPLRRRVP